MRSVATIIVLVTCLSLTSCTPAAKTAIDNGIQVAVDTCTEIENFVPPTGVIGSVVGLICQGIDAGAPVAKVIVDSSVWTGMKREYLAKHGALPKGVSPVVVSIDAGVK